MRKFALINLIVLLAYSGLTSNTQKYETLMWEISRNNSKGKVFLLGSIHLADSSVYPLHHSIEEGFSSSNALVLEVIIDQVNPMTMMQYLTYKDGRTLESELPSDVYEKISKKFEESGIPKFLYNKFKPWFALISLQSDAFKGAGLSAGLGIDMYFLQKARDQEMEVLEIESLESQVKLLDELGEFTGDYLNFALQSTDSTEDLMPLLLNAWKNADDKELEKVMNKGNESEDYAQIMEKLNYKRNENMSSKIDEYLNSDMTYFVVVGAAHVIGSRGIIDILNKSGNYNIRRF